VTACHVTEYHVTMCHVTERHVTECQYNTSSVRALASHRVSDNHPTEWEILWNNKTVVQRLLKSNALFTDAGVEMSRQRYRVELSSVHYYLLWCYSDSNRTTLFISLSAGSLSAEWQLLQACVNTTSYQGVWGELYLRVWHFSVRASAAVTTTVTIIREYVRGRQTTYGLSRVTVWCDNGGEVDVHATAGALVWSHSNLDVHSIWISCNKEISMESTTQTVSEYDSDCLWVRLRLLVSMTQTVSEYDSHCWWVQLTLLVSTAQTASMTHTASEYGSDC